MGNWTWNVFTNNFDKTSQSSGSTSGSTVLYSNSTAVPTTIGGIASGSTFSNQTMQQMWDALLYPYQTPTFGSFALNSYSTMEVGSGISTGSHTFTWTTTNPTNIIANSINIIDVTNAITLISGSANDGTEAYNFISAVTKSSATTHQYKIEATNSLDTVFNRTLTLYWRWRGYYGESTSGSLTEVDVKALRVNALQSTYAGTYVFNAGGYKWVCYNSALGTATSFKDSSNNLDVAMEPSVLISVTNDYGITSNVRAHRTTNIIGSSISIIVA